MRVADGLVRCMRLQTLLKVGSILLCTGMFLAANAQKSVADLKPAHAAALETYLRQQPHLEFLSETKINHESLKGMRQTFGASLTPFYRAGDFNRDGLPDFAVVLATKGARPVDQGPNLAETHRYHHSLLVVIFNGQRRGGYRVAFERKTTAPLVSFLAETSQKPKKLYFAVYETDEHFVMAPARNGYRVESQPH